jgi:predicted transcriptional regulator
MPLDPEKIRARRVALNLSQTQASQGLMPRSNWARVESGDRIDPALSTAEKIASALKCPLAKLLK